MTVRAPAPPLCTTASLALGEDPIGTAPRWDVAVALDLPTRAWEAFRDPAAWSDRRRDVLARIGERVKATGRGYGLFVYDSGADTGRVRLYTRAEDAPAFERADYLLDEAGLPDLLEAAVLDPARLPDLDDRRADPEHPCGLDLHVCTHGRVDAACGKFGYPLYEGLQGRFAHARAWRTAHFGGHRFAPTVVELPAGRYWGRLTPEIAEAIVRRDGDPAVVARHLRGWVGLDAWGQVVDRELFVRLGWEWLDLPKRGATLHADAAGADVRLDFVRPDGTPGACTARVEVACVLDVPGSSHKPGLTAARQYRVASLELS